MSTTENLLKQRIVHCGTHLQAKTGDCAVAYFLFADKLFPAELKKKIPKIFCMNKKHPFYIVLCHPELDASELEYYVHSLCIYPELLAKQEAAIKRDIEGLKGCEQYPSNPTSQIEGEASSSATEAVIIMNIVEDGDSLDKSRMANDAAVRERFKWITVARDGAYPQINATQHQMVGRMQYDGITQRWWADASYYS